MSTITDKDRIDIAKFIDGCIDRNVNCLMQACRQPDKKYNKVNCPFETNPENAELYESDDESPCSQCDDTEQCFD